METKSCVLVVDDEPDLVDNIGLALEADGYHVLTAGDGIDALSILKEEPVNLILADIAMPRMNGYQLYEHVRANPHWIAIPFIFLTARKLDSDVRYGKELGVDDYLTKPIHSADLLAAVRGKLRRAQQLARTAAQISLSAAPRPHFLRVGQLRIDSEQHRVWWNEREVNLSAKEFVLLEYLAQQAGKPASVGELVQITHQLETNPAEAGTLVRPLIRSLRRKLGYPVGEIGCIENVRGVGYRLALPGD